MARGTLQDDWLPPVGLQGPRPKKANGPPALWVIMNPAGIEFTAPKAKRVPQHRQEIYATPPRYKQKLLSQETPTHGVFEPARAARREVSRVTYFG